MFINKIADSNMEDKHFYTKELKLCMMPKSGHFINCFLKKRI